MKVRNYEKHTKIYILLLVIIIFQSIILYYLYNYKIYTYENINAVVIKDNLVVLIINKKQDKILNKNSLLYLNSKKIKYKIVEDRGYVLERKNIKYKEVLIEFKFDKNYKVNDTLNIILKKEKIRLIEIFKIIWEGD